MRAMGLAERVTTSDQGQCFLVVHCHIAKGAADVGGGRKRIMIAVRTFRIDVDQTHLGRGQRPRQIALAIAATVGQHLGFRTPVDHVRLPGIDSTAGKTDGLEAHVFERDITGQYHQVTPGQFATIFLLDRPDQTARLVEADIVGPAIQRFETLFPAIRATASVTDAIGTGAVPGHADEEGTIMTIIGWPPVLRSRQSLADIFLDRSEIERREFRCIVIVGAIRIGLRLMLAKRCEVEALWPPVLVRHCRRRFLNNCLLGMSRTCQNQRCHGCCKQCEQRYL